MISKISKNFNILVIDDDRVSLTIEAYMFQHLKIMTDSAQTTSEALSLIENKHYDAVLMDIDSDYAVDSLHLINKIKQKNKNINQKVEHLTLIFGMITAFNQNEEQEQYAHTCFKKGLIDICAKPVPPDFVNRILQSCQAVVTKYS